MNAQLQKQIILGGLAGLFAAALTWFLLGGKRDELKEANNRIEQLKKDVSRGYGLKQNAEKFQAEAEALQKRIDDLVKIMPTEDDKGDLPYRMKKLADSAGVDLMSFKLEAAIKKEYFTEHPIEFKLRVGFHTFGHFTSLVSGFEKIINVSDIQLKRLSGGKTLLPAEAICRVTAFVYNPNAVEVPPAPVKKPGAAPVKSRGGSEE